MKTLKTFLFLLWSVALFFSLGMLKSQRDQIFDLQIALEKAETNLVQMETSIEQSQSELGKQAQSINQILASLADLAKETEVYKAKHIQEVGLNTWQELGNFNFLTSIGYLELPLLRKSDYFEIQLTIGEQNAFFLLDTGASQTVMDIERAERFESVILEESQTTVNYSGIGGQSSSTQVATISKLAIGDISEQNRQMHLVDLGHINTMLQDHSAYPIDG
ncbi:MAG TPA: hypothetical protein ENN77_00850, partial [Candidatus Wirthbacteria bacterium]|nr:hypothetical protein [Candidatus Wirthbacteria bacterium]